MSIRDRALCSLLCVILCAAVYYTDSAGMLLAFLIATAVHELSHLGAMRMLRCRPTAFHMEPSGFHIEYLGRDDWLSVCVIALSGPIGGALAGAAALALERRLHSDALLRFAELNLFLSAFNLLPILPLDGGSCFLAASSRALGEENAAAFVRRVSRIFTVVLLLLGAYGLFHGAVGAAFPAAGLWLLCLQNDQGLLANGTEMG